MAECRVPAGSQAHQQAFDIFARCDKVSWQTEKISDRMGECLSRPTYHASDATNAVSWRAGMVAARQRGAIDVATVCPMSKHQSRDSIMDL